MFIHVQMSILNGGGFLEVIRVLQTVGAQIKGLRAEKVVGLLEFLHYFSELGLQTTHFRNIYVQMCIF